MTNEFGILAQGSRQSEYEKMLVSTTENIVMQINQLFQLID